MTRPPDSPTGQGPGHAPDRRPAATPGWYPDTIGGSAAFRWWDGAGWTQAVSESLWEPEPKHAPPYVPPAAPVPSAPTAPIEFELEEEESRRKPLLIGIGAAAVLLLGTLGVLAFAYAGQGSEADSPPGGRPAAQDSAEKGSGSDQDERTEQSQDPEGGDSKPSDQPTVRPPAVEGWPTFQTLGKSWWVGDESVVPHAKVRHFTTEENYSGDDDWIATVLTGAIPKQVEPDDELARTANRVADWYAAVAFGPDREPNHERVDSGPIMVADRPAHRLKVRMPYELSGLKATSDTVEVVVVDLGPDRRPGLYLAAVPNTNPELWKICDKARDSLSLDG